MRTPIPFILLSLLFYYPTRFAGFTTDWLGWQTRYDEGNFADIFTSFGYTAHQPVLQFFNYSMYQMFGTQSTAWYILFAALHGLNAWLLSLFLKYLTQLFDFQRFEYLNYFGAVFFLLSPYQTEAVVWRVCLHYILSATFTLTALLCVARYLESQNWRDQIPAHICFLLNLYSLELGLVMPLILHALVAVFAMLRWSEVNLKKTILQITLPQIAILAMFFGINKMSFGGIVGHYGAEKHLDIFKWQMLGDPWKYLTKYAGFVRHYEHNVKVKIFENFNNPLYIKALWAVFASLLVLVLWKLFSFWKNKTKKNHHLLGIVFLLILGFIAILPVANLFFEVVLFSETDRYGYFASLFFLPAVALFFGIFPAWLRKVLCYGFAIVSAYFLVQMNKNWEASGDIHNNLLGSYSWQNKKEVFVLNLPDNMRGIWMFRQYGRESIIEDGLNTMIKKPISEGTKIHEVAWYNMTTPNDGVKAEWLEPGRKIKVEFKQWGNWWWKRGLGGENFENDRYSIEFKGQFYELTLKGEVGEAVFIYQLGRNWYAL